MRLPRQAPVMILDDVVLFPRAVVPLYIFELRYKRMLADALDGGRMFALGMCGPRKAAHPSRPVAGLGLIRACVSHEDGTAHLMLQGLARVELGETVQRRPYRVREIDPIEPIDETDIQTESLVARLVSLVGERFRTGPIQVGLQSDPIPAEAEAGAQALSAFQDLIHRLDDGDHAEELVDLISGTLLPDPHERQIILETRPLGTRLRHLIRFLAQAIRRQKETDSL